MRIKKFNEDVTWNRSAKNPLDKDKEVSEKKPIEENDVWEEIQGAFDVYQLMQILRFKFGDAFPLSMAEIKAYEGDYNPDHVYEVIEEELKSIGKWSDFITNWEKYSIENDESDPMHWRHRQRQQQNLMDRLSGSLNKL